MSPLFPFSAVVGQDQLKLALILSAVDPGVGGVLLRGQKGSAKTTLARALAALLPGAAPFVELPVGASEDRLVGTLDLAAALGGDGIRFEPGLLAAAHGGVLYVDEVNLLPDHLVDVLLDVATSGVNRVEREGVSHTHPSRFVLIGSMNPEEGELRPQLLDRFGLSVEVVAPTDALLRAEVVRRRLAFDADPEGFVAPWAEAEAALAGRLAEVARRGRRARPVLSDRLLEGVSSLCVATGAEGLRADLTICRASAALAAWEGRTVVDTEDIAAVAALALAHRRRRGPLEGPGLDPDQLAEALQHHLDHGPDGGEAARPPAGPGAGADEGTGPGDGSADAGTSESPELPGGVDHGGPGAGGTSDAGPGPARGPDGPPDPDQGGQGRADGDDDGPGPGLELSGARGRARTDRRGAAPGRRSVVEGPRGRLVGDRVPTGVVTTVAVGATVRAALGRPGAAPGAPVAVVAADLREAVRQQRSASLVVVVVDASGSMGSERRLGAARGAVLSLLLDAYQRRDLVSMVTFGGDGARVVLRPTGSVEVARARLAELTTGGRTPLDAGILTGLEVALGPQRAATHRPLLVVVTDGRATAAATGGDPGPAALAAAVTVRLRGVDAVVVDVEDGPVRLGLARPLAEAMAARYLCLPELSAPALDATVRHLVAAGGPP